MHRVHIHEKPFQAWTLLEQKEQQFIQAGLLEQAANGAAATFVGTMRDFNEGNAVKAMQLEHYPGMTENQLEQIIDDACTQHNINQAYIAHRVGRIEPSENIVLVAVWSAHRKAAFDACRSIMEDLKHRAPFWKKEITAEGERWVTKNTQG